MQKIFLGLLFVFLNFHISIGSCQIGLIPDFVGYLLMGKGLEEMAGESTFFVRAKPLTMVMVLYTAALYAMDLFSLSVHLWLLGWVLGLAALGISLVISYWIVCGVREMETARHWNLRGQHLSGMWMCMAVVDGIASLCSWIPLVGLMGAIGAFAMGVLFLVAFHHTESCYRGYMV